MLTTRIILAGIALAFISQVSAAGNPNKLEKASNIYSGPLYHGQAEYEYYEDADYNRVFHGSFKYEQEKEWQDSISENFQYLSYNVNGYFENNSKDGKWSYVLMHGGGASYNTGKVGVNIDYQDSAVQSYDLWISTDHYDCRVLLNLEAGVIKRGEIIEDFRPNFGNHSGKLEFQSNASGKPDGRWIFTPSEPYDDNEPQAYIADYSDGNISAIIVKNVATGEKENIAVTDSQKISFSDFQIEKLLEDVKQTEIEDFNYKTDFASQLLGFVAVRYAVIVDGIISMVGMPEGISEHLLLPPH